MQAAGFKDFERGERGSTAAHLGVLEYKIKQDKERLAGLAGDVADKEEQAAALDKTLKQKGKQLAGLDKQLTVTEKASAMYSELERMGKKNLWGHMELLPEEFKKLLTLAKSGLASQGKLLELQRQLTEAVKGLEIYRTRWQDLKGRTKDYMELERLHPEQTRKALESLKRLEPETSAPTQSPKGSGNRRSPHRSTSIKYTRTPEATAENLSILQAYVPQEDGKAKIGDVLYIGTPENAASLWGN